MSTLNGVTVYTAQDLSKEYGVCASIVCRNMKAAGVVPKRFGQAGLKYISVEQKEVLDEFRANMKRQK